MDLNTQYGTIIWSPPKSRKAQSFCSGARMSPSCSRRGHTLMGLRCSAICSCMHAPLGICSWLGKGIGQNFCQVERLFLHVMSVCFSCLTPMTSLGPPPYSFCAPALINSVAVSEPDMIPTCLPEIAMCCIPRSVIVVLPFPQSNNLTEHSNNLRSASGIPFPPVFLLLRCLRLQCMLLRLPMVPRFTF